MLGMLIRLILCASCFACVHSAVRLAASRLRVISSARQKLELEDVLRDHTLCFLLFGAVALVISYATSLWLLIPSLICSWLLSAKAPGILDKRKAEETRRSCDEHVDTMADIVSMGVQSGLSFDAAMSLYCSKFDNALSQNLSKAQIEWKSGLASRQDALLNLSTKVRSKALKRFTETSLQAIHYGSPLANLLTKFSGDIRQRKRNAIERQIAKAPVKMLIPTGTCILPAMLILVMGPVLLQFMQTNI